MSIEKDLSRIATALEAIVAAMTKVTTVPAEHAPVTVPVAPAQAPAPAPAPEPVATVTVSAPAPAPTAAVPFSDPKSMIQYVMDAYKALGPQKGAQIQDVLKSIGHSNINEVRPDQYAALYAGIEGLK